MTQGIIYIIIIMGCIALLLDELLGSKRVSAMVERMLGNG